jgi:hypothetical protein
LAFSSDKSYFHITAMANKVPAIGSIVQAMRMPVMAPPSGGFHALDGRGH